MVELQAELLRPPDKAVRNMPNFLIVGAAKAMTTSIWYHLKAHPEIYMSPRKELFFLSGITPTSCSSVGSIYARDAVTTLEDYLKLFQNRTEEKVVGEATVAYLYFYKPTIQRILDILGRNVKILISLRNPVDRAYSNYNHHRSHCVEPLSFEQALLKGDERERKGWWWGFQYLKAGYYYDQVKAYLDTFGRKQVFIVFAEDFAVQPRHVLKNIFRFLEVDDTFCPQNLRKKYNHKLVPRIVPLHRFVLSHYFKESLGRIRVSDQTRQFIKRCYRRINMAQPPPLPPETKKRLIRFFYDDILRLQDLIQTDLSHWFR
ncbi:MAG: sulfotransferase domain-containing protein [Candidatus Omnitrophica bacterium]|nr:sulfotransferase domain-containing protein [Candidatus Omnitrophota bacterium]